MELMIPAMLVGDDPILGILPNEDPFNVLLSNQATKTSKSCRQVLITN